MHSSVIIRDKTFEPALFCAPLAGLTHCSFRRLASGFGGCGGFFTEMLAGRQILNDDAKRSPYLRRSPGEKRVIYQLMVRETDPLDRIVGRLAEIGPDGVDVNLACHAPAVRQLRAGSGLFENATALAHVLTTLRRLWSGLLSVKIRLGSEAPGYEARFTERMRLFEECGVDAVTLHARFFEDKHKRSARHDRFAWAAAMTRLPIIANGDIVGPETVRKAPAAFASVKGLMVGRMAAARPWLFADWEGARAVDLRDTWLKAHEYIGTDFVTEVALKRIKLFTKYFARNFLFGHNFHTAVYNAPTLEAVRERGCAFLDRCPALVAEPSLMGL
jgi:tRNA-dihydrouridine synthase B